MRTVSFALGLAPDVSLWARFRAPVNHHLKVGLHLCHFVLLRAVATAYSFISPCLNRIQFFVFSRYLIPYGDFRNTRVMGLALASRCVRSMSISGKFKRNLSSASCRGSRALP